MSLDFPSTYRTAECETCRVGGARIFLPTGTFFSPAILSPIEVAFARAVRSGGFRFWLKDVRGPTAGHPIARGRPPEGCSKLTGLAASHAGAGSARTVS